MFDTREALEKFFINLEPNVNGKPLAASMMIGMILTLDHPEYAQAFFKSFVEQRSEAIESYATLAAVFVVDNPIEVEV